MEVYGGQKLVNNLRSRCDQVKKRIWIVVPYIGNLPSVFKIIGRNWIDNPGVSFRILTDADEFNNINSATIGLFAQYGEIRSLAGVHAKVFITDSTAIVTSANLTATAFTRRHEVGVFLGSTESSTTISLFKSWWKKAEKIDAAKLKEIVLTGHESTEETAGKRLAKLWDLPAPASEVTYWLKPIGVSDSPITEKRTFEKIKDYLHFSTPSRKPKVFKGDILIEYGIGARQILSVYRATSDILRVTKEDIKKNKLVKRWPWYVIGKNLTPRFGKYWFKHELYASVLVDKFLSKNPDGIVTRAGSRNLNALMRGKDKIKLDDKFAQFVIKSVNQLQGKR